MSMIRPSVSGALLLAGVLGLGPVQAKIPVAPMTDEAKAKAAEAAAKTAWSGKVASYQLCKSMDAVAAAYFDRAKKEGKAVKPAVATPACADPGPFVAAAPTAPAAPAAAAAPAKK